MDDDVAEALGRIESKLDSVIEMLQGKKAGARAGGEGNIKPSDRTYDDKMAEMPESSGRTQCPECGSLKVKEMTDKSKPLSMSGGMTIYAKKHVCGQCGAEW